MIRIPARSNKRARVPDSDESFNEEENESDFENGSDGSDEFDGGRPSFLRPRRAAQPRPARRQSSRHLGRPQHNWDFSTELVIDDDEFLDPEADYNPVAETSAAATTSTSPRKSKKKRQRATTIDDLSGDDSGAYSAGEEPWEGDESASQTPRDGMSPAPSTRGVGRGRGRGRGRGSGAAGSFPSSRIQSQIVKGEVYRVVDEELELPTDPKGDAKIDADGNLLDGREFKVHTFTSPQRHPTRKYILGVQAGRQTGFKESSPFFRAYPLFYKLKCTAQEREMLINMGILHSNARFRSATIITARSAFKLLGALIVQDGKFVNDDYYEQKSLDAGHTTGEPANVQAYDPAEDRADSAGPSAANGGGGGGGSMGLGSILKDLQMDRSEARVQFGGHGATPFAKWDPAAKQRRPAPHLTPTNWALEYAKAVRNTNSAILGWRREQIGPVPIKPVTVSQEMDEMGTAKVEEMTDGMQVDGEEEQKPLQQNGTSNGQDTGTGLWETHTNIALLPQHTQPQGVVSSVRQDRQARDAEGQAYTHEQTTEMGLCSVEMLANTANRPQTWEEEADAQLRAWQLPGGFIFRQELQVV